MSESPCIYCLNNASTAKGKEHIIPEALGFKETLPHGYVCDACNQYLSSLDNSVLNNRAMAIHVGSEEILGKKGKPRRHIGNKLHFHQKGHLTLTLGPVTISPGTREAEFKLEQNKEFDELRFARGIHKIAFNCFASRWGHRTSLHPCYNQLRGYIRQPQKGELWTYAVKESPNSGEYAAIFHKTKWGEIVELRLLCLDFLISLTGWRQEIEHALSNDVYIIKKTGQWGESSLLGLRP